MSPEFGATATLFPIDDETLAYLRLTGRPAARVDLVERYAKAQGLWREPGDGPEFDALLELDLRRWSRRWPVRGARRTGSRWRASATTSARPSRRPWASPPRPIAGAGDAPPFGHGSVAIAAITSCTNTSNPTVMVGAGLLARNAVARGLHVSPTVKTSLAPGSRAVTGYLERAGLMAPLADLGLRAGRLRLHDLHRQLAARSPSPSPTAIEIRRADRRGRPVGQPQLRGPDPPPRAGLVPRLAAAGGGVRARRPRGRRPHHASRWASATTGGRSCSPTSGRRPAEMRTVIAALDRPRAVPRDLRLGVRGRRALDARCRSRRATGTRGTRRRRTSPGRRSSRA